MWYRNCHVGSVGTGGAIGKGGSFDGMIPSNGIVCGDCPNWTALSTTAHIPIGYGEGAIFKTCGIGYLLDVRRRSLREQHNGISIKAKRSHVVESVECQRAMDYYLQRENED